MCRFLPLVTILRPLLALLLAALPACQEGMDFVDDEGLAESRPHSYCTEETDVCFAPMPKSDNQCIFYVGFDGSGVYSPYENSAIGVFYQSIPGPAAQGNGKWSEIVSAETTRAYVEGVPGIPLGASAERVQRGLDAVCQHLDKRSEPCDIVLMGYSRGAIIASHVAQALNEEGCAGDGRHKGEKIAFLASFDPVLNSMGDRRRDRFGNKVDWNLKIPTNVQRFQQLYKAQLSDPNSPLLTTTVQSASVATIECTTALTADQHPKGRNWAHGEVAHFTTPHDMARCTLEDSAIEAWYPTCSSCTDENEDGWGWENDASCKINVRCYDCKSCDDADGDGWGWEDGASCRISPDCY